MEQTLVVYSSETGFTQRFALCIAQTLHCEMIDVQFLTASDLKNRSLVIYGGHLVGNKVLGLKSFYRQFKEDLPEQFIVFGSGVVRRESVNCQQIAQYQQNHQCQCTRFYYLQGHPKLNQMNLFLANPCCVGIKTLRKPILPSGSRRHSSASFGCDSGIESLICYGYR